MYTSNADGTGTRGSGDFKLTGKLQVDSNYERVKFGRNSIMGSQVSCESVKSAILILSGVILSRS